MNINTIIKEELESLLTEKLVEVNDDVNLLYDKYFKDDINEFQKTGEITSDMFDSDFTYTSVLTNDLSKQAHQIKPCKIVINDDTMNTRSDNFYSPQLNLISVGVNSNVVEIIKESGNLNNALKKIPDNLKKSFQNEITEHKLKGSIHHELTHWVDDTLHGNQVSNYLDKFNNREQNKKYQKYANTPNLVNTTDFEVNSQIHNIKHAYDKNKERWDSLTFDDLGSLVPAIGTIYKSLSQSDRDKWLKQLKKRMHREGLLGKKMYNI